MDRLSAKATRQHLRDHNSRLVLRTIYDHGQISRADLARRTELTRATVSAVVGALIDEGLVEEIGSGPAAVGRTPILLSVAADARRLICVNLTGTELDGAVLNLRGAVRARERSALAGATGDALLERLDRFVGALLRTDHGPLLGIGICTPGVIDTTHGVVRRASNIGWSDLPLRDLLQGRYRLPVYLVRDSHAVALAEYMFGPAPTSGNLLAVTVDQGVGAGVVLDGQIFTGDSFGAGEIGHVVVDDDGPPCLCGNQGCLEALIGATGLLRAARVLAQKLPSSPLGTLAAADALDWGAVAELARRGEPGALRLIATVARYLGIALANLVGALNIRRVLVTGAPAPLGELLAAGLRAEVGRRALPQLARATSITVQPHGPETPLFGVAALLLTHELGLNRVLSFEF
ncbi:MAG TPA: ROK family transcriptional regulator [Roseiflexaceae bacterium]|nr:ROK family transcriptional regulator [Roseiflexaceae bacterium]